MKKSSTSLKVIPIPAHLKAPAPEEVTDSLVQELRCGMVAG
ncbi:MAG: hypothetical protein WCI64_09650 [Chlorobium sp.]